MFWYLTKVYQLKELRKKIFFTIGVIVFYRILAHISVPGVNVGNLVSLFERNEALGVLSMMTGGSMANFSIVLMWLSPYINASIIMQLLTVLIPELENLSKEGDYGRKIINKWTKYLTVVFAAIQSWGMILLLNKQAGGTPIIDNVSDPKVLLPIMLTIVAGTLLLMWLGELITEKGIGNGVSMIITVGIISNIPVIFWGQIPLIKEDNTKMFVFLLMIGVLILLTVFVVLVTEWQKRIPLVYSNSKWGQADNSKEGSFFPIKVNQAGMIPMIFAISVMMFPAIISNFFINSQTEWIRDLAQMMAVQPSSTTYTYMVLYFLLVVLFTFFYVSITFSPDKVADSIQKRWSFIPGVRPGKETEEYLEKLSKRLNLFGGTFLWFVAVFPLLLQKVFNSLNLGTITLFVSGAGLIIMVWVALELYSQIESHLVASDYDKIY